MEDAHQQKSGRSARPVNDQTEEAGEMPVPLFKPLDHDGFISKRRRALPHWEQSGCSYFVTFRLADSLPMAMLAHLREWKERWLQNRPKPWTEKTFRELDTGYARRIER